MTDLYGLWQTRPWAPPAAVDGRVPRNERGNVEVPPFVKALPAGTVREVAGAVVAVWVGRVGPVVAVGASMWVAGAFAGRSTTRGSELPPAPASTLPAARGKLPLPLQSSRGMRTRPAGPSPCCTGAPQLPIPGARLPQAGRGLRGRHGRVSGGRGEEVHRVDVRHRRGGRGKAWETVGCRPPPRQLPSSQLCPPMPRTGSAAGRQQWTATTNLVPEDKCVWGSSAASLFTLEKR